MPKVTLNLINGSFLTTTCTVPAADALEHLLADPNQVLRFPKGMDVPVDNWAGRATAVDEFTDEFMIPVRAIVHVVSVQGGDRE